MFYIFLRNLQQQKNGKYRWRIIGKQKKMKGGSKEVNNDWFETDFSHAQVNVDDSNLVVTDRYIVGVNTVITKELKDEGLVRDLIRQIQNLRKKSQLKKLSKL